MLLFGRRAQGAKNVSGFRENVRRGRLPPEDSITYEGLYGQYFFKTGCDATEERLLATYSIAQCPNPITGEIDRFVSIGMNSVEDGKNRREPLNLIIVLDISGSMNARFQPRSTGAVGESDQIHSEDVHRTKMDIAKEVLAELAKTMTVEERMGIVLFNSGVEVLQPLRDLAAIDQEDLLSRIGDVRAGGGTNMTIALTSAIEMLSDHRESQGDTPVGATNNRIVFLTDANPNEGGGTSTLVDLTTSSSANGIYTTFIGIGLDFNSTLVEKLTKVRGANYFSVHSRREFQRILNEDFNYVVSEIAYDATVTFESDRFEIGEVFGTPLSGTPNVVRIGSCSASSIDERGLKGGLILVKLREKDSDSDSDEMLLSMTLRYVLPDDTQEEVVTTLDFGSRIEEIVSEDRIFEHEGIRKAVLLAHYGSLVRGMLRSAHAGGLDWVTAEDIERLKQFKKYYEAEATVLKDRELIKELDTVDRLIYQKKEAAPAATRRATRRRRRRVKPYALRIQKDLEDMEPVYRDALTVPKNLRKILFDLTPSEGVWQGKLHRFEITIPEDYPIHPPRVVLKTPIWHPNYGPEGNPSLNILAPGIGAGGWMPIMTLEHVLIGLHFLFMEPNPNDCYNDPAARMFIDDYSEFERKAREVWQPPSDE